MLATLRCSSYVPSICFNHTVSEKKYYPVHKAPNIKKSVRIINCVAGSSATERGANLLTRDLEPQVGCRAGSVASRREGFEHRGGSGDTCGSGWPPQAGKYPALAQPETLRRKETIFSLLFFFQSFFLTVKGLIPPFHCWDAVVCCKYLAGLDYEYVFLKICVC